MNASTIEFKEPELEKQFNMVDFRIAALLFLTSYLMKKWWDYQIVVTSIHRTEAEQQVLIKTGFPAIKNSPHEDWRAADVRLNNFPHLQEIGKLLNVLNFSFRRLDGLPTALVHGSGAGIHLHLQVPKEKRF